jgi:hypothetical protein
MSGPRLRRFLALVIGAAIGLGCGDYARSTSPPPIHQKLLPPSLVLGASFSRVSDGTAFHAVRWGRAHQKVDQSVSALVGPEGGTLSLPGADFSMEIPAGALTEPTTITVVARGGRFVVYDMYPHGLSFLQPVTAEQGLSTTASYQTWAGNAVRSAYLPEGREQIGYNGSAAPAELEAATTFFYGAQPVAETHLWILNHFSRYILISGVMEEVEDDGGSDDPGSADDPASSES